MRHLFVRSDGVRLHCAEEGEGPPVVLLHGFPEFWYAWRRQLPALAAAGLRAVAADLRGYGRSDRPPGVESYRLDALVEDVAGLLRAVGAPATLVGHDWGGVLAWYTAMHHPALLRRLVVLNAPHPAAYARELRRFGSQWVRSWYAGAFQIPALPERVLRAGNFALLRRILRRGPARTEQEVERYVEAFAPPGALSAAIHYYRAALRFAAPRVLPIRTPTLLVWGEGDPYLDPALAGGLERWVPRLRVERLPRAGHWLHHREAETVGALVAGFAGGAAPPAGE